MQIFISSFGNNSITVDVNGTDTMCDVKHSVEQKLGIPSNFQQFRFGGRQIIDNCSLTDQKIYHESTLQLLLYLRGGMHKFRSIPTFSSKNSARDLIPDALEKYNTSFLGENVHVKPKNKVSTKKDTNGKIASIVPFHEQESTEKAENCFEYLSREADTQKMQPEKQSHMGNLIEVDVPNACQAGQNDVEAWWRSNKAEWFAKKFRGLHSAVAEETPPRLLHPKEHCSLNTYTSRSTAADLLMSLCLATVCADVTVSNAASLLTGDCWVIQGFFFAMFLRTTVNVAIFSQEDDEDLLVEMHCVQGDRGAFQKLCEYIVQRCDLRRMTDSDPITVSNATAANNRCLSASLEPMQEYKTFDFEIDKSSESKVNAKCSTNRSRCNRMSSPARAPNTVLSLAIPRSPLRLHLHDSYTPPALPARLPNLPRFATENNDTMQMDPYTPPALPARKPSLPRFAAEDDDTRQQLRMLVKRQAECHYQESKMMFWRQIACLTSTDSVAAHELLVMCVEGCRADDDTNILLCMKKELSVDMRGKFDLQYCVLASLFHAVQANQRMRVPLPLPLLHPTVLGPLSDVVSQATKFTAEHHANHLRVYALGLASWLTCQQVAASVSCGATLPIAVPECAESGLKT